MTRLLPASIAILLLVAVAAPGDARQHLRERIEQRREAAQAAPLPPGARIERDIAYGAHPRQRYDAYLPARVSPHARVIVMVHGGGWRNGDKRSPGVTGDKAAHWLERGDAFVSVNYRLLPDADPLQQAADVAAAIASIQRHAPRWGADPGRLVLMGHSAGAHLVALLGSEPAMLARAGAARPLGVVSLDSGALDVAALMSQRRLPRLYRDAFGSEPSYWAATSPQARIGRDALPMLLACSGTRHVPTSPCDEARAFARKAAGLRVPMQVLPLDKAHGEINRDLGKPSAYTRAVSDWIDRLLN